MISELFPVVRVEYITYNGDKASMKLLLIFSQLFLRFFVQLKTECLEYLVKLQSFIPILYSIYPNDVFWFFFKMKIISQNEEKMTQNILINDK